MPTLDLVARFIGIDAGAGREFDRLSSKSAATGVTLERMAKAGALGLAALGVGAIKAAGDYQKLTVNLVTGAGEQQRNLKMVSDGMLHMAGQVGYSAGNLAKAMYTVESAGFHGAAALNVLKTSAEGAKVDNADLTTVVDALTSAMNAYHTPTANAAKVTNTLIASASVGKMHLQDLAAALGTVLPSAAALHVSLAQVGAAMATMTEQGTDSNRAATYLRFSLAALANPTAKAQGAMASLGLTSKQVADEMMHGGLTGVFTMLENAAGQKFPHSASKYFAALANMVGGTRGLQAVLQLTGKHMDMMNANLTTIQNRVKGAGNSVSDWGQVQKTFNQQLDEFAAGLQANAIVLGQHLLPVATAVLHVITDLDHAVHDTASFFEQNKEAAAALAVVLGGALLPKLLAVAGSGLETLALKGLYAKDALTGLVRPSEAAAEGATGLAGALNPVTLGLAAVVAGGVALTSWIDHRQNAALQRTITETNNWVRSLDDTHDSIAKTTEVTKQIDSALHSAGNNIGRVAALYKAFQNSTTAGKAELANESALQAQYGMTRVEIERLAKANHINLAGSYDSVANAVGNALTPTQQFAADTQTVKHSVIGAANSVQALTDKLNILVGNYVSADSAQNSVVQNFHALRKAINESNGSLDRSSSKGLVARDALDTLVSSIDDAANANLNLKGGADKARTSLQNNIAMLKALHSTSPVVQADIRRLSAALANIPSGTDGKTVGENYGQGLIQGLADMIGPVGSAAHALGDQINKQARQATGTASPSKHAIRIGRWYAQGLAIGMNAGGGEVYLSAKQVAHQLAMGLEDGWHGESVKVKDAFSQGLQGALSKMNASIKTALDQQIQIVKTAYSKMQQDRNSRNQAVSSLAQSISGSVDIGSLIGMTSTTPDTQTFDYSGSSFTTGTSANSSSTYTGNLGSYLKGQAALLKQEASIIGRLRKAGLSKFLINQIASLSPQDAITIGQQVLSGQDGTTASLNAYAQQIYGKNAYAQQTARTVEDPFFRHQIHQDHEIYVKQLAALHAIRDDMRAFFHHSPWMSGGHFATQNLTLDLRGVAHGKFTKQDAKDLMKLIRRVERESGGRVTI